MSINKKKVLILTIVLMLLLIFTGCKKQKKPADEANPSEESEVTILENEGEIEIEIPEDMESDGF